MTDTPINEERARKIIDDLDEDWEVFASSNLGFCQHEGKPYSEVAKDEAVENIAAALERVRREERERCANIATQIANANHHNPEMPGAVQRTIAAEQIAQAIRATPESEGE